MSLNAAAIELLLAKGLSGDDMLALARALEADKPRSSGAKRQAAYRERKRHGVTGDVTSDVTKPVTTPPNDNNSNPPGSEANASGGDAADPVKELFDVGVALLTSTGTKERQARSLLGKWRKDRGDGEVLTALLDCRARSIANPVEWLEKRFGKAPKWVSPSGYEYRGSDADVLREAERRNDMTTYWAVKGAMAT